MRLCSGPDGKQFGALAYLREILIACWCRFDKLVFLGVSKDKSNQLNIIKALTRKYVFVTSNGATAIDSKSRFVLAADCNLAKVVADCPLTYTGADFYALCSDAMLQAMLRRVQVVDKKVKALGISPNVYFEKHSTAEEVQVVVEQGDFSRAMEKLAPSLSAAEILRYDRLRKMFEGDEFESKEEQRAMVDAQKGKGKGRNHDKGIVK